MTGSFLIFHVTLIVRNTTTNELDKWDRIQEAVIRYKMNHGKSLAEAVIDEAKQECANGFPRALEYIPKFGKDGLPVNIYNRGVWQNVREVFAPIRYLRGRTAAAKKDSTSTTTSKTD
ncbi:hypothetical protein BWQ96_03643 [Gracilariopsis chorda]|uniref:Uncharacterized protein n=1 Tax=Gracilariopsis chorda TaxID=448386 RepID=A0A2V3IWX1_9FLOR|nr:hypothetical protein BWQ96_03643 [Gracilariopsis chorda]|eukprot:PXF46654.1 hypothetical protein BWQ96_03643 [Gracilariopsis chorda]